VYQENIQQEGAPWPAHGVRRPLGESSGTAIREERKHPRVDGSYAVRLASAGVSPRHVRFRGTSCPLVAGLAGAAWLAVGCGGPTLPTTTIIIPPPAITCPVAPPSTTASNGLPVAVSYGTPTVAGGTAPVSAICTPSSGSPFNVGSTTVTCTATDAVRRTNSCAFAVNVTPPSPRLGVTRILAFGDSITEGEVPEPGEFGVFRVRRVMPNESYPADLTSLLAQRYAAQGASRVDAFTFVLSSDSNDCTTDPPTPTTSGIVVVNAGCLGAQAHDTSPGGTLSRFVDKMGAYSPNLLLLQLGVNDLDVSSPAASISQGLQGVQSLIGYARSKGVPVLVGTLLPMVPGDVNAGAVNLIVPFNNQLWGVATSAGATVVDLYTDIAGDVTDWISPYDGLHPTAAGYQEMARVWFNAVKSAFELPQSSTPSPTAASDQMSRAPARGGSKR
jgi:lysophospholipase L1-like esterase